MPISLGTFWAAAAAVLLVGGVARAGEPSNLPGTNETAIGIGIICDTSEQAEHFINRVASGQEPGAAMSAINAEEHSPRACGIAAVAFTRDETVGSRTVHGKLMEIVRINVIAGFNGAVWHSASGTVQYAVMESKDIEI
jgi:hypothetical protein